MVGGQSGQPVFLFELKHCCGFVVIVGVCTMTDHAVVVVVVGSEARLDRWRGLLVAICVVPLLFSQEIGSGVV